MNCHLNIPGSVTDVVIYHIPSVNYRILFSFASSASTAERKQEVQGKLGKKTRLLMHSRRDTKLGHGNCQLENTPKQRHNDTVFLLVCLFVAVVFVFLFLFFLQFCVAKTVKSKIVVAFVYSLYGGTTQGERLGHKNSILVFPQRHSIKINIIQKTIYSVYTEHLIKKTLCIV